VVAGAEVVDGSRRTGGGWIVPPVAAAIAVAAPILAVIGMALMPGEAVWHHLATTVLPAYALNTFTLVVGVGVGVLAIGTITAWLVTMCEFPGRRAFEWALLLPMAIPAYVVAFVYTGMLEYAGPVQSGLRAWFDWSSARDYWFPDIRTVGGAVAVMTLVLYPYVYLLARAAFTEQSVGQIEVARTLGRSSLRTFVSVALPLARPALVAGTTLALLEALNDFGTVDYFAVNTFTRGIFNVWLGMNNLAGAAQIAVALVAAVVLLMAIERGARGRKRFRAAHGTYRNLPRYTLPPARRAAAFAACALPVALGFVVPAAVLVADTLGDVGGAFARGFVGLALNSLVLALAAAALATAVALFLAYAPRVRQTPALAAALRVAGVGYAMPGAVLAVGVLIPFGWLDNRLDAALRSLFGVSSGLLLSGTVAALIFAYVVRFLAVALGSVDASFAKVPIGMDHAARTLGASPRQALVRVGLPLIRPSLLAAALLVFVDVMKELPMTLILRPFNFNTLATRTYEYAGGEQLAQAAPLALAIVLVGIVPVIMLSRAIAAARPGQRRAQGVG
jgi:iron(III) transport system permease protein